MLLRRTFRRRKDRAARYSTYSLGLDINRVASSHPIPNEQCVVHEPQVGDENPLHVFLNPRFDVRVEHSHFPQLLSSRNVGCNRVLVSSITVCRISDSIGFDRRHRFGRYDFRRSSRCHECEYGANNYGAQLELRHSQVSLHSGLAGKQWRLKRTAIREMASYVMREAFPSAQSASR
jgi:hypothetical protein